MSSFDALLFRFFRLASNRFELLIAEMRWVAGRQDQIRQISEEYTLDGQCGNVVNESVQSDLRMSQLDMN